MPKAKTPPETATPSTPPETGALAGAVIAAVLGSPRQTIAGDDAFPGGRAPFFPPGAPMPPGASLGPSESPSDYIADGAGGWRRR